MESVVSPANVAATHGQSGAEPLRLVGIVRYAMACLAAITVVLTMMRIFIIVLPDDQ